ncbi:hypothetical protein C0J52_07150 [Blattella germanica]|nr:hypothetical protein C0J52_07150 [Blattella germanica]
MKSGLTDTPRWQWKPNDRPSREPRRLVMPYCSGAVATVSSGPVSYKMPVPMTHSRYSSSSSTYRTSSSLSSSLERPFTYSSLSRTVPRSTSYTSEYKSKFTSPSSTSYDSSTRSSISSRERSVETRERKNSTTSTGASTTTTTTLGRRFGTSSSTLAGISVTEMFSKYSPNNYSSPTTYSSPVRSYTSSRTAPGGCSITKVNNNEQDDDNGNLSVTEIRRRFDGASVQNGARSSPSPVVARKVYNDTEALSSSEEEDEEEEEEEEEMTSRSSDSPSPGGVAGGAGNAVRRYSPAKLQPAEPVSANCFCPLANVRV